MEIICKHFSAEQKIETFFSKSIFETKLLMIFEVVEKR